MPSQATTLDVTTLAPLPCAECGGTGKTHLIAGSHIGGNKVIEPIYRIALCGTCKGTGEAECQRCGETAAVTEVEGDAVCARCAEEANANARLIADAPALLDALAEVIRYDDLTQPCDHAPDPESCTHCRARELIAKHKEMRNA